MKRSTAIVVVLAAAIAALGLRTIDSQPTRSAEPTRIAVASFEETTTTTVPVGDSYQLPDNRHASFPDGPATLVVYSEAGEFGYVGEGEAIMTANLLGAFGPSTRIAAGAYQPGQLDEFDALAVVSSVVGQRFPDSLLDDIASSDVPLIWMGPGLDQLFVRHPQLSADQQLAVEAPVVESPTTVVYRGVELTLPSDATEVLATLKPAGASAQVVATAVLADGTTTPWAVRTPRILALADAPFAYHDDNMSYLVLADQMQDLFDPDRLTRHRAMVRLEDIGPAENPEMLMAIADVLAQRDIPFSMAVYPVWRDPAEVWDYGMELRLADSPDVVEAIRYAQSRGGTVILHGYTHQRGSTPNPYDGTSGADYEFFSAHLDENDYVVEDGPFPDEMVESTRLRIQSAMIEMLEAGFDEPTVFEFPHYAAAQADYQALAPVFDARFERSLYYLSNAAELPGGNGWLNQWFPYPVVDTYAELVLPENLGNVEPAPFNQHPATLPSEIVANARLQMVVEDNLAAFFYHPFFGPDMLAEVLDGMLDLGYEFVDVPTVLSEWNTRYDLPER